MENKTKIILDSINDGVFTIDSYWFITSFNKAAERITGVKKEDALGMYCWEVLQSSICKKECYLKKTLKNGKPYFNKSMYITNSKGEKVPVSVSTARLKNNEGRMVGGVETLRDIRDVELLRKELTDQQQFNDIISKNEEMHRLFDIVRMISDSNTNVLLEGESGTGKELFAKAIHNSSPRKDGPLIALNCSSIPDTLLESELFGYKKGAFTDAKNDKPGRLALAHNGTLFLDEIGDISPLVQIKLLRVLQEKEFEALGDTKTLTANVRIIAASNKKLKDLVKAGKFREDLYYRLNVAKLYLPPLRERKEDVPLLINHFIEKFNTINDKEVIGITPEVISFLMNYDFPGNIRELENIIEYSSVVCKEDIINIENIPEELHTLNPFSNDNVKESKPEKKYSMDSVEKDYLLEILEKNNWNRATTAKQMGIHTSTLWRKIKRLKLVPPKTDGRSYRD